MCHSMFVTISILGKGLEFKLLRWRGPIVLYISWYKNRVGLDS
jgi:hypothetical protein